MEEYKKMKESSPIFKFLNHAKWYQQKKYSGIFLASLYIIVDKNE